MLEEVIEYHHHPLPAICSQAVNVTCWFYLFMGAFASQPCDHCKEVEGTYKCPSRDSAGDFWYLFQVKGPTMFIRVDSKIKITHDFQGNFFSRVTYRRNQFRANFVSGKMFTTML